MFVNETMKSTLKALIDVKIQKLQIRLESIEKLSLK